MPTLTLHISTEQLDALLAGQSTALTATLRAKKAKASTPLSPDELDKQRRVIDRWLELRPGDNAGRVWKALRGVPLTTDDLLLVVDTALSWHSGRRLEPEWVAKDHAQWLDRAYQQGWSYELERDQYRQRLR